MNRRFAAAILCCILLYSCISPHGIHMKEINQQDWSLSDRITVPYHNSDSTALHNINIIIRINSDFEYDKLNLVMCTVAPDGRRWTDTISVSNLDKLSFKNNYTDIEQPIRGNVKFQQIGNYSFIFNHLMPVKSTKGITAIGINIK